LNAKGPSSSPRASHRLRPAAAWSLAFACLAVGACAGRYHPTLPLSARSGDIELTVESWHPALSREIVMHSRSQTAHTIRAGWNTVATRDPCSGGAEATQISVDSGSLPAATGPLPLPPGEHEIRLAFPRGAGAFEIDTVVDLELDDHACSRVPAVSQYVPMRALGAPVVVVDTDLAANTQLNGLLGAYILTLGVGRWVGPALITASAGIAGSTCKQDLCGKNSDGSARVGLAFPFLLETRSLVHVFDGPTDMANMLTAGARYTFMSAELPLPDGSRRFAVHGLQAVLGWSLVAFPRGPFSGGEHGAQVELSLPVGVLFDPSAPSRRFAASFGFGIRYVFPLL
jgi:hypothetical protein